VKGIPGSGHLFEGHFSEMQAAIAEFFLEGYGRKVLTKTISEISEAVP